MTLSEALAATAIMQVNSVANVLVFRVMDYVLVLRLPRGRGHGPVIRKAAVNIIGILENACLLRELDDFIDISECKSHHSVGASVIYGNASGLRVVQRCTRESHVRHVAGAFI